MIRGEVKKKSAIHYGWYVVAAGTLCVFASLELGPFIAGMAEISGSFTTSYLLAFCLALVGAALSLLLPNRPES